MLYMYVNCQVTLNLRFLNFNVSLVKYMYYVVHLWHCLSKHVDLGLVYIDRLCNSDSKK